MRRFLLTLFVLLATAAWLLAGGYADRYTEDGYVYHADTGYWYASGAPYTRTRVDYTEQVYYCGRYYSKPYYYYRYSRYYPTAAPVAVLPYKPEAGWRAKLLEIKAEEVKVNARLQAAEQEQAAYLEAIRELGLGGKLINGYGGYTKSGTYGGSGARYGNYGASGNSLYAAQQSQTVDIYGASAIDLNVLFQQASAQTTQSGALYGQGLAGFQGLVGQVASGAARVAEIRAKAELIERSLRAQPSEIHIQTQGGQVGTVPGVPPVQVDVQAQLSPRQLAAAQNCVKCHAGANAKGGYEVLRHWTLPDSEKMLVVREHLLLKPGQKGFMPDGAAAQLPPDVIMEFMPRQAAKPEGAPQMRPIR